MLLGGGKLIIGEVSRVGLPFVPPGVQVGGRAVRTAAAPSVARSPGGPLPFPGGHLPPLLWLGGVLAPWGGCPCLVGRGRLPALGVGGVQVERPCPFHNCHEHCPSLSPTLSPAPPEAETMASKPEKRVASSVFITLVPPRRDEAVVEEVRRAACEAWPGRPWESAPMKAPAAGSVGKLRSWMPPGRAAAPGPAVPPQLSNGGKRVRALDEGYWLRGSTEMQRKGQALGSFVEHLLCSRLTLESTCLGLDPDSFTCWLCDFGRPLYLSVPQFLNL